METIYWICFDCFIEFSSQSNDDYLFLDDIICPSCNSNNIEEIIEFPVIIEIILEHKRCIKCDTYFKSLICPLCELQKLKGKNKKIVIYTESDIKFLRQLKITPF